jgi:hypothetical protein
LIPKARNSIALPANSPTNPERFRGQQLADAIAGTPTNCNGVQLLNLTVSDPPTQSELQAVANKLDELISALRR